MALGWLGAILEGVGGGVSQLPQLRRQREQLDMQKEMQEQQLRESALRMSLSQDQEAREQAAHKASMEKTALDTAIAGARVRPEGTALQPDIAAQYERFSLPMTRTTELSPTPVARPTPEGGLPSSGYDITTQAYSKPLEDVRLQQELIRQQGQNQRMNTQLAFRYAKLQQDKRIAEMINAARMAGVAVSRDSLSQRMAEMSLHLDDLTFDNQLNAWKAQAEAQGAQFWQQFMGDQAGVPSIPPVPQFTRPTPSTPAAPRGRSIPGL